jgi:hypothetical protein
MTPRPPIRRDLAALLAAYLAGKSHDRPVFPLPCHAAENLAGIECRTDKGYVDFHELRHTYVT